MERQRPTRSAGWGVLVLPLLLGPCACDDSSGDSPEPVESSKVRITTPTTDSSISVATSLVVLGGPASIDAWSYAMEVEPNVRWLDTTTGAAGEASEHVEWLWLFGWVPTDHTWEAQVPLVSGWNEIRVEAYYSTSGTAIGSDSIRVHAP
jgi:hypothetical protein